jgi:hypothetical protein
MTYLKDTTLVDTITLHGWIATLEVDDEGLHHAIVEVTYKESSGATHFINACGGNAFSALHKLSDKLSTIAGVLLYTNPWEDKTNDKLHELSLLLGNHASEALHAA